MSRKKFRKSLKLLAAGVAALGLSVSTPALAWGDLGHRTIANIALANVSPKTKAAIDALLTAQEGLGTAQCPVHSLGDAATWPDCLRSESWRWGHTFPWHYHDGDITAPAFDMKANCSGGQCATFQITRFERILADKSLPVAQRLEALAFLSHIVGDLHQPLHAAEHDHDAGGNGVTVTNLPGEPYIINTTPPTVVNPKAGTLNLHWMWDNFLVIRAQKAGKLPEVRAYSVADRAKIATGGIADWAQESWQIAHDTVYPQAFGHVVSAEEKTAKDVTISDAAIAQDIPIVSQRLLQGGLRLAKVLDETLGG
ncbi:MAG: hypothetical protein BGP00_03355 [Novosphingobium sp. 63-713]|uniref:S1/P1 nuclease n=1 Tax=unclassified Novosphingobium TaxID=2644732 RepID=UPI0008691695|nr:MULTISPECIES: S1/P1 nuclease [unclassified Novosphingobium]MBN9145035.1 S1/P1 nuclease [Novosphingobium sp.]MDR6708956.1 hypothetical protein [Novosphingobium sp. 1748]ODU71003.1 MAG: hypothetical protein ABT11_05490 [Novosphingobium sp. SCN 66-18]OJX89951.1 MAG: hypothetical protein BGP00_03355 [Novosphingobium sp. 63-713]